MTSYSTMGLLFIHGIQGGTHNWEPLVNQLFNGQYYTMTFDNNLTIQHNFKNQYPESRVWVISYYTKDPIQNAFMGNLTEYSHRLERLVKKLCPYKIFLNFHLLVIVWED